LELAFIVKAAPFGGATAGIIETPQGDFGSVKNVAESMFTDYLYPFELTGVLLLVAVIGAVVVAKKRQLMESGDTTAMRDDEETEE